MSIRRLFIFISLVITPVVNAAYIDATSLYQLHSIAQVIDHTKAWHDTDGTTNRYNDVSDTVFDGLTGRETVVFNTFIYSRNDNATLTLDFGSDLVGNRTGIDLAIFTLNPATLAITVGTTTRKYTSNNMIIDSQPQGVFSPDGTLLGTNEAILIDLDDFIASNAILSSFTINVLSAAENPVYFPAISAVGAFNTTVVPLPLPIVLFGSGLAFLGFVGRRKKA